MSYNLYIPKTIEEAYKIRKDNNGEYLAAGTIILVEGEPSKNLIALEKIKELSFIKETDSEIVIGSCTTLDDIENYPSIKKYAMALYQSVYNMAGPQIRNRATIGGNISCFFPSADTVPALIVLDSSVTYYDGQYHTVKLQELKPFKNGELLVSISIPKTDTVSLYEKVGRRNAMAIPMINIAISRCNSSIKVAVGSVAPHVVVTEEPDKLLSLISPIDDNWGTAEYKREICANLLKNLLERINMEI